MIEYNPRKLSRKFLETQNEKFRDATIFQTILREHSNTYIYQPTTYLISYSYGPVFLVTDSGA